MPVKVMLEQGTKKAQTSFFSRKVSRSSTSHTRGMSRSHKVTPYIYITEASAALLPSLCEGTEGIREGNSFAKFNRTR